MTNQLTDRPYRGQSMDDRRRERRQVLLDAALTLVGQQGYSNISVRALCNEAGLTERYFYESFKNREAMLAELYTEQTARLRAAMIAAISLPSDGTNATVGKGLRCFFSMLKQEPELARVILFEVFGVSKAMDELYYQAMEDFAELLRELALALGLDTTPPHTDSNVVYAGLVGACVQMARRWVLDDYREDIEMMVESARLFFRAVAE
ncbi:TetR/AcrR family transcriptional regulator [Spongiibacter sp. KMU-166]|uniref:TetR/AcrR family transcriptional regulator n=1 Tax=Spongiibacter thalassae TaxID=2721624 RepID=A0ABX1GKC6_9GAMM|nr:TetR/AcrR family transcriptional regulator [Spongiibacter thalassae]NKI19366.1 TetR/AcrR family transcriptional regulator [Spongiibacter thalassae]